MYNVTVVVTASAAALNPSLAIITETLLSLRLLSLPAGTPVLISHDGPRISGVDAPFPPNYLRYIGRLQHRLPEFAQCTGLNMQMLLRGTNGSLARNIQFALGFVRTPFVLKVEHDHIFVRPVPLLDVVDDMVNDPGLRYVRFNRRENIPKACDVGYPFYNQLKVSGIPAAKNLFGTRDLGTQVHHKTDLGLRRVPSALRCNYTRTVCFSDMNHLTTTRFYLETLLPPMLAASPRPPESAIQLWMIRDPPATSQDKLGTHIYGALRAPPTITHLDGANRGVGERRSDVQRWMHSLYRLHEKASADGDEVEVEPFRCRETRFRAPEQIMEIEMSAPPTRRPLSRRRVDALRSRGGGGGVGGGA